MFQRISVISCVLVTASFLSPAILPAEDFTITLSVIDADDRSPVASRVYLESSDGKPFWFSTTAEDGSAVRYEKQNWINKNSTEYHTTLSAHSATANVPPGEYQLTVERGKCWVPHSQAVTVEDAHVSVTVEMKRWVRPEAMGWYSGDTHIHRTLEELRNVVLAEDLNVVFPLTNWVTVSDTLPSAGDKNIGGKIPDDLIRADDTHVIWPRNTEYEIFSVRGKRHTLGALFVLGHRGPLKSTVPPWKPVVDSAIADDPRVAFDMDKLDWPFAMTLPTVTDGALYELANNHVWRTEFAFRSWNTDAPAYMQPPFGASEGGHRQWLDYSFGMYYTLLNCGFRLPPSAGTANGVHPVPAGFSRVYVHQPDGFDYDDWLKGLKSGRSFVTTGPMLFADADDHDAGHVFKFDSTPSNGIKIPIHIEVASEKPLSFGELIINGRPEVLVRVQNQRAPGGTFFTSIDQTVSVSRSGWFAIRFFEERDDGQTRFAHTGPWYVEIGDQTVRPYDYERRYLVERMQQEIDRSADIVSAEAMKEYKDALQFYQSLEVIDDSDVVAQNARVPAGDEDLQKWLANMIVAHRFTPEEVRSATGLSIAEAEKWRGKFADRRIRTDRDADSTRIEILPYPGGRHPRRGFLDGAIDPQRDTKVSVFPPWKDGGYVVIDVPEAIFSNLGLTYLAHTHIPTIWDDQGIELERLEWTEEDDGALTFERRLPNGIEFGSKVSCDEKAVDMEMWLTNGTDEKLTGLRSQVCVMLKGAIGFNSQQIPEHKVVEPFVAILAEKESRWIITAWQPCKNVWANSPVPCIHSDPVFPDCNPGETVRVNGKMWFYEGDDIDGELKRLAESFSR